MEVIRSERTESSAKWTMSCALRDGFARNFFAPARQGARATADNKKRLTR
jgi:ribosomal protein L9